MVDNLAEPFNLYAGSSQMSKLLNKNPISKVGYQEVNKNLFTNCFEASSGYPLDTPTFKMGS